MGVPLELAQTRVCPPGQSPGGAGKGTHTHTHIGEALTDGGDEGGVEGIVGEAEEHAGLADPRVPDEEQLEEQVVGFLRHREAGGRRRPLRPPLLASPRRPRSPGAPAAGPPAHPGR